MSETPTPVGARDGGEWDRLRARLEQIRRTVPPVDTSDDTPAAATAEVRARQAKTARDVWEGVLDRWPDDDFSAARLADLGEGQNREAVERWLADLDARLLVLHGPAGRGKTHIAMAVGSELAGQGFTVRAFKHARYLEALMPGGEGSPERQGGTAAELQKRAQDADGLVLDEFGGGVPVLDPRNSPKATPFAQRQTTDLLSMRLRGDRKTVVTTNMSSRQLAALFDDRTVSRLTKNATVIHVSGPDRRATRMGGW